MEEGETHIGNTLFGGIIIPWNNLAKKKRQYIGISKRWKHPLEWASCFSFQTKFNFPLWLCSQIWLKCSCGTIAKSTYLKTLKKKNYLVTSLWIELVKGFQLVIRFCWALWCVDMGTYFQVLQRLGSHLTMYSRVFEKVTLNMGLEPMGFAHTWKLRLQNINDKKCTMWWWGANLIFTPKLEMEWGQGQDEQLVPPTLGPFVCFNFGALL